MICDTILDAVGNTPLIRLHRMVEPGDAEVLVKFEGLEVGGSIKTRTALKMIERAEKEGFPVDAVAVSEGPGSYTGLRIGVSMAKGVCYGRHIPLLAIPTLQLLTVPLLLYHDELPDETLFVPMIDARRMEVYAAVFDRALHEVRPVKADIVTADTYAEWLERGPVCFFGTGAPKCKSVITHPNARFVDDIVPLARHMVPLAERALARGEVADTAYFEPFYLKEFVATKPKNLLLD